MIQGGRATTGSTDRRRFAAALGLFLAWVGVLVALAAVSSYRPDERTALPDRPASPAGTGPGAAEE